MVKLKCVQKDDEEIALDLTWMGDEYFWKPGEVKEVPEHIAELKDIQDLLKEGLLEIATNE